MGIDIKSGSNVVDVLVLTSIKIALIDIYETFNHLKTNILVDNLHVSMGVPIDNSLYWLFISLLGFLLTVDHLEVHISDAAFRALQFIHIDICWYIIDVHFYILGWLIPHLWSRYGSCGRKPQSNVCEGFPA